MVRLTRNSSVKKEEGDISNDGILSEEDALILEENKKGPPASDMSYAIKVAVGKENSLAGSALYALRHPKNDCPVLFRIGEEYCEEVLSVGEKFRSWFYGDSVVEDGSIRLFSPFHPLFIALPYFVKEKSRFVEMDEILKDEECPAISLLSTNKQFMSTVEKIADRKDVCDCSVFRFNEEKALEWVRDRFDRLKAALVAEGSLHKGIVADEAVLDRYAFGVLCDFLCPQLVDVSKTFLCVTDAPSEESDRMGMEAPMKRKGDDEYEMMMKPTVKKARESVVKKQLQQASKGTKSIGSFFAKKK